MTRILECCPFNRFTTITKVIFDESVLKIDGFVSAHGYPTVVMGASFRNKFQCLELAGCDLLTISPALLKVKKWLGAWFFLSALLLMFFFSIHAGAR